MPQSLTDEEFDAIRLLRTDHAAELDPQLLENLIHRRFVVAAYDGHAVTLGGNAAFLIAIGKRFETPDAS